MVTTVELAVLVLALAFLVGASRIVRTVKPFVVNAVVGLLVLLVAAWFGLGVTVTPLVLLVVAIAGGPGALLVILLHVFDIAFVLGPVAGVALLV
ncbi:hypothetical protein [Haloarchaeobius sp. TZWWS8]|uniref:hypothetical protein n=1 Tax=Haloarchaeobius sp. TZWWS8 TaxID=3446121 RepID=UPI003EB7333F